MNYSYKKLVSTLKRVYVPFAKGLTIKEFHDLRDCVEIARACGAFDKKQVTMYADRLFDEQCRNARGDALADIDAGVDDVFDRFDKEDDE